MKVRVDPARCQGHTLCTIPAPDVFLLDEEEGHAHVQDERRGRSSRPRGCRAEGCCHLP